MLVEIAAGIIILVVGFRVLHFIAEYILQKRDAKYGRYWD